MVLLNIDAGELDAEPEELTALAHVVHLACGGHAGDAATMERAVRRAQAAGTALGAHPSYPDRGGFGRRPCAIDRSVLVASIEAQCRALREVADACGAPITSAKPHGALYHDGAGDPELAVAVTSAIARVLGAVTLVGPATGGWTEAARAGGLAFLREGFADRGMRTDGSLVPRGEAGALLSDPEVAAAQAARLLESGGIDTLCVHGDGQNAVAVARAVRRVLDRAGP